MLGFFNKQAEKNNLRVEKYNKLCKLINIIEKQEKVSKLGQWDNTVFDEMFHLSSDFNFVTLKIGHDYQGKVIYMKHLRIYEKSYPITISSIELIHQLNMFKEKYGERIKNAGERNDWKAIYHSVRIGYEIKELLQTGEIKFPLAQANMLLKVRNGEIDYDEIHNIIGVLSSEIENLKQTTHFPKESDIEWINDFVFNIYMKEINNNV